MILNRKGARPSPGGGPGGGAANKPKEPAPPKVIEIIVGVTITELARKLGVSPEKVEKLMIDLGESPAGTGRDVQTSTHSIHSFSIRARRKRRRLTRGLQ